MQSSYHLLVKQRLHVEGRTFIYIYNFLHHEKLSHVIHSYMKYKINTFVINIIKIITNQILIWHNFCFYTF